MRRLVSYKLRASYLTIGVSLWFLVLLWRDGELYGRSGVGFCLWFLVAAVMQLFAPSTSVWIVGVLAQLTLAVTLILKRQLNQL